MRYLKTYKIFESFDDDADTMARYQLFGADTIMAFGFNREHITDVESIKDLIEKYNEFYVTGKSWSGGPPPRAFVEYFNKNYSEKGNASLSSWYPTIDLMIETLNYGTLILGFSIIDKSYKLINWGSLEATGQYAGKDVSYDKRVLSEISKYINKELIDKLNMYEVIDILNLKITNKFDWDWKERFNEGTLDSLRNQNIVDELNDISYELKDDGFDFSIEEYYWQPSNRQYIICRILPGEKDEINSNLVETSMRIIDCMYQKSYDLSGRNWVAGGESRLRLKRKVSSSYYTITPKELEEFIGIDFEIVELVFIPII
jgi:hypothetical protein